LILRWPPDSSLQPPASRLQQLTRSVDRRNPAPSLLESSLRNLPRKTQATTTTDTLHTLHTLPAATGSACGLRPSDTIATTPAPPSGRSHPSRRRQYWRLKRRCPHWRGPHWLRGSTTARANTWLDSSPSSPSSLLVQHFSLPPLLLESTNTHPSNPLEPTPPPFPSSFSCCSLYLPLLHLRNCRRLLVWSLFTCHVPCFMCHVS